MAAPVKAVLAGAPTANDILAYYRRMVGALRMVERAGSRATFEEASPYFGLPDSEFVAVLSATRRLALHRHWLAHGRRWPDKTGLPPDAFEAASIIRDFFLALPGFSAGEIPGS
jgi:hypothetical protein